MLLYIMPLNKNNKFNLPMGCALTYAYELGIQLFTYMYPRAVFYFVSEVE